MSDHPMKLGLFDIFQIDPTRSESPQAMYARRLDDLALADELGFDVAFVAERHFLPNFAIPSASVWLAAASQRTARIRLGALGYTLPIKSPVQLAEEIAMLDHLSGGRLEVGFGLGHRVEELIALGQDPQHRVPLFQRRLAVLRALWSGGEISFEQDDIIARSVAIHPLSLQELHPPLWFAGTEPGAAHWMGANGLGLAVGFKPTSALIPTVAAYRGGRELRQVNTGEPRPLGNVISMRNVYVSDSDAAARIEVADDLIQLAELQTGAAGEGSRADRREQANRQVDAMIRDEIMIAGGPDSVAAAIRATRDALQVDTFLANIYAMGLSDDRIQRSLRLLAGPVRRTLQ
jgi:alkanesulfonate monooxygenase SsuD/methylene tetrahydromethanopterin reductase-like flavin-dependent oxidoreductase (luciferase family)